MKKLKKQEKPKPRGRGLNLVMFRLSKELSVIIGKEIASRAEIVKLMWAYIKKNELQDENSKRWVIPDKTFAKVFGEDRIYMFDLAKKIVGHMRVIRKEK